MFIDTTKILLFVSLLCFMLSMTLTGQNINDYKWKHRVILIITTDSDSKIYLAQIEEYNTQSEEFSERRLITYHVLPHNYLIKNDNGASWVKDSELFEKYNSDYKNFKIILIGLDGSIKIEQNDLLTAKKLFTTIDGMPMRRAELKNK